MDMTDSRARRTRARLEAAARDLVETGRWQDASVQSISDRAGIARSSFYQHFVGKDALLTYLVEAALRPAEAEIAQVAPGGGRLAVLTWLAWHVRGSRELYRAALGPGAPPGLRRSVADMVAVLLVEELENRGHSSTVSAVRFAVAGALAILEEWLESEDATPTPGLEDRLQALVGPAAQMAA